MNFKPLVSIIVPSYNYGKFLAEALDSISAQTYSNWECIIVNDGSTDNSEEIGLKYQKKDARFIYIHQKNGGHYAARNTALAVSAGKYIQFLDADDMLEYEKLDLQVTLLEENLKIDLVYSDILAFKNNDPEKKLLSPTFFSKPPVTGKGEVIIANLIPNVFFLPGCVIMKKSLYEKVGAMKSSYAYEDWEFFFRIALANFYFYHDSRDGVKLLSRTHGNNTTHKVKEMIEAKIYVRKEIMKATAVFIDKNKTFLSKAFVEKTMKDHKIFLAEDEVAYNFYHRNYLKGFKNILLSSYYSGRPLNAFNSGLKWTYYGLKKAFG